MKVLLIGNGGRESAIAWKISNSGSFTGSRGKMFVTGGNPGINKFAVPVDIKPSDTKLLAEFAKRERIDFTVTGPEIPLSLGIVNEFEKQGLKIFGPSREAARIESSKVFAKKLMLDFNIPTAGYEAFSGKDLKAAKDFLSRIRFPAVIKTDGLAAGKGVIIINSPAEFDRALAELESDEFIIEEYLDGEEVSVFAVTDGADFVILPFSQDHKKILDGEKGKNTGGMGAVAPVKKFMNEKLEGKIKDRIIGPVLKALQEKDREFRGCLYCGLMIAEDEPFVIEFNCRFGDPETQAVLPLIESDFLELLMASGEGRIKDHEIRTNDKYSCCIVLASEGYPGRYETGKMITGIDEVDERALVFQSGTRMENGSIVTDGGRVLSVVGISGKSLADAVRNAYENAGKINFENKYLRSDIGFRQLTAVS